MSYEVDLLSRLSLGQRDHQGIFVETHETIPMSGHIFHVIGNVQQGMEFEHKTAHRPEDSAAFSNKVFLGNVKIEDYPQVLEICEAVEPPKKQFEKAKRIYPGVPLRKCQEWTKDAVAALLAARIIQMEEQSQA